LDRAARRALTFLLAVGRDPVARGLLETRGYSANEHAEGWRLLRAVDPTARAGGHRDEDEAAASPPPTASSSRTTSRGVDPAVAVTPRQARVALAILTSCGAGDDVRETVHRWLDFARKHAAPTAEAGDPDAALLVLHEWLSEWRLVARKVVTRNAHLVALGLAGKGPAKARAAKHA